MDKQYLGTLKIFYHPDRIDAYLNNSVIYPITVKMYLTNRCNIRCNHCIYADRTSDGELLLTEARVILDKLKKMGVKSITLTGGEPTLYKDIKTFGEYANDLGFEIGLITNGVIYPKIFRYLKWVRVSLDTSKKETYVRIKGIDRFGSVLDNIKTMVNNRSDENRQITIGTQMVVVEENHKEIVEMAKLCRDIGVDYFQIRPVENKEYDMQLLNAINGAREKLKALNSKDFKVIQTGYKWEIVENGYKRYYNGCPAMDFMGAVDTKGNLYPCCFLVGNDNAVYGNMLTDSIDILIKGRNRLKKKIDYDTCPAMCQGTLINKVLSSLDKQKHVNFL